MTEGQAEVDFLTALARSTPDKIAAIDDRPDGSVALATFAKLEARANRLANALLSEGIEPHDRVAWCGPNSIDALVITHVARKICVTPVAINYRLTDDEMAFVVRDSGAVAAWIDAEYAERFARIHASAPNLQERSSWPAAMPRHRRSTYRARRQPPCTTHPVPRDARKAPSALQRVGRTRPRSCRTCST